MNDSTQFEATARAVNQAKQARRNRGGAPPRFVVVTAAALLLFIIGCVFSGWMSARSVRGTGVQTMILNESYDAGFHAGREAAASDVLHGKMIPLEIALQGMAEQAARESALPVRSTNRWVDGYKIGYREGYAALTKRAF